jgi:hypothetical protein
MSEQRGCRPRRAELLLFSHPRWAESLFISQPSAAASHKLSHYSLRGESAHNYNLVLERLNRCSSTAWSLPHRRPQSGPCPMQ